MTYRYRVAADVLVEEPLTTRQLMTLAENVGVLANTSGTAEMDGVQPNLRVQPVISSAHQHDSTDDYACQDCREMSRDCINSNSQ